MSIFRTTPTGKSDIPLVCGKCVRHHSDHGDDVAGSSYVLYVAASPGVHTEDCPLFSAV